MENIVDLISLYDLSKEKRNDTAFLSNLLKELRKSKMSRPDIVIDSAKKVLKHESGNEVLNLKEQLVIAALSTGDISTAEEQLVGLVKKFPDSVRVKRLVGMTKEAEGKYTEALELYGTLLTQSPANILVMKRKVCVYKARGEQNNVISELNAILKLFPAEASSWLELGEIYLSICSYEEAVHCFEELVLLDPNSFAHHLKLAEAYYTLGGLDNYLNARKHYVMSLNLQSVRFNLRSAYGLISTCKAVETEHTKSKVAAESHDAKVNKELQRWAKNQLNELAESHSEGSVLKLVNSTL